jgi:hypothetical protein
MSQRIPVPVLQVLVDRDGLVEAHVGEERPDPEEGPRLPAIRALVPRGQDRGRRGREEDERREGRRHVRLGVEVEEPERPGGLEPAGGDGDRRLLGLDRTEDAEDRDRG